MSKFPERYLTLEQAYEKYKFLNKNRMKNLLAKNKNNFRDKCIRKIGHLSLLDEDAFLAYIASNKK